MSHPWCKDIPRDESVRASEDGRSGPLPTLEECIERVTERRPPEPGGGRNVTGSRTERVTLEITRPVFANYPTSAVHFQWQHLLRNIVKGERESVRVVDTHAEEVAQSVAWEGARDAYRGRIARLTDERDAAIRERDALRAERITQALTADRFAAAVQEADRLRARVAELESSAKLAPTANGDGGSNHAAPAASGAAVLAEIAAAFGCDPDDYADLVEAARLLVRERDDAVAKAASGAAGAEAVAWGVIEYHGGPIIHATPNEDEATQYAGDTVPLYAAPQPASGWLTAEERGSIWYAIEGLREAASRRNNGHARTLDALLGRSSPPEVVLPGACVAEDSRWQRFVDDMNESRDRSWLAALAAAGVTVKEVGRE